MILPSVYAESPSITFIQKLFIIVIFKEHNSNHTATTVKKSSLPWHPDPLINICKCTPVNRNSHSPTVPLSFHLILSVRSIVVFYCFPIYLTLCCALPIQYFLLRLSSETVPALASVWCVLAQVTSRCMWTPTPQNRLLLSLHPF